jgi:hypothetical protein
MYHPRWITVLCAAALFAPLAVVFCLAQEPATPVPSSPASASPAAPAGKPGKKKYSHASDFLIRGTVFNDKTLSAPAVRLRIRRAGDKKFHWETYTDSRGEFAVRVPHGSDYEVVVRAKGFAEQTRTIDAKNSGEENVVFRMQPAAGGKK